MEGGEKRREGEGEAEGEGDGGRGKPRERTEEEGDGGRGETIGWKWVVGEKVGGEGGWRVGMRTRREVRGMVGGEG